MMFGRKLATVLSVVVVALGASAMTAGQAQAWDQPLTLRARVTLDPVEAVTATATPA